MALDAQSIAAGAGRPVDALTRRDIAHALLGTPSAEAVAALPGLRRQLIAAGNPMSAAFWDAATVVMQKIVAGDAVNLDVQMWLEATGNEPSPMIGMLVWDEVGERGPLQAEIYDRLVAYLDELLASGQTDPDRLIAGDETALREHRELQEDWMMAPLPDGRVPMWVVMDETDEEFEAEWDAAEAEALAELRGVLAELPDRPVPEADLHNACGRIRSVLKQPGWPGELLAACGGVDPRKLPGDDAELWLALATGIVSPQDELPRTDTGDYEPDDDDELTDDESAMVALCALDHIDWLATTSKLARRGPGTLAGAADLARYVSEFDEDDPDDQADAAAEMFGHVVRLWEVLGAVDDDDRLTRLGWWGIPEAVVRAWEPQR